MYNKLFVNEEELINKGVKEGLNKIATNSDIAVYLDSQIDKNNSNPSNEKIEIRRLMIVTDDDRIFINPNTTNFCPRMLDNILSYLNKEIYLSECDIGNTSTPSCHFVSDKHYYYYNSIKKLFIIINMIKLDGLVNSKLLFNKEKILNSFYPFLDNKSKQIYNEIIFPILDKSKQNCHKEKLDFNIRVQIRDNKTLVTIPKEIFEEEVRGLTLCHPEDEFDIVTGIKTALDRALNRYKKMIRLIG